MHGKEKYFFVLHCNISLSIVIFLYEIFNLNKLFQQSSTGIDQHKLVFQKATDLMKSIVQSPVPVIAKVSWNHHMWPLLRHLQQRYHET